MPTPRKGERKKEFINRCIPMLVDEGKPQNQAIAQCHSIWDNKEKRYKPLYDVLKGK